MVTHTNGFFGQTSVPISEFLSVFLFYCLVGGKTAQDIPGEQLRKRVDRMKYRCMNISIFIFCLFSTPSVVFLRSIPSDRFRNKISAQVSVCMHANVLIRLASAIDEISFFKFFSFSFPFLSIKEQDHPSLSLSLMFSFGMKERRRRQKIICQCFDICATIDKCP